MKFKGLTKTSFQALSRWRRGKLQRTIEWQSRPSYWKLRERWNSTRFRIGNRIFRTRYALRSGRESAGALRSMMSGIITSVLLSLFIVCALEVIEFIALRYGPPLLRFLPIEARQFLAVLSRNVNLNTEVFTNLFSTFAEVAGAFLALYFTAVSVVISTVYARVQGDVRSILLRDKFGNGYVSLVALLGAASTLLLASMALGRQPGVLNLSFVTLLGVAAIFSFVQLGLHLFYFFDPTRLINYLAAELVHWVRSATPNGYRWLDPAFQAHYQKQAGRVLTTYRNIVLLANREEHLQSEALVGLASSAFGLLRFYSTEKSGIPSDSLWFRRTHQHQSWFHASWPDAMTAMNTGTPLRAEVVPDLMWFESEVEETVAYTLEGLFSRKDLESAYSFSNSAEAALKALAANFAVDESLHLFRTLAPLLRNQAHGTELKGVGTEEALLKMNYSLGLTDIYGLGFAGILLGLFNRLRGVTADSLGRIVSEVQWHDPRSIYDTGLPRAVVGQMEELGRKLDFEREVEGRLVTPLWYRQQLVALAFVRFIEKSCLDLLNELELSVIAEAEALVAEKRSLFAAQLIDRGLEACNKFVYHFASAQECYEGLAALRKVQDIPWPVINWEDYYGRIKKARARLITALMQTVPDLAKLPKTKRLPDYFGHAYALISDECYRAMSEGDEALFKQLFPTFFMASWEAFNQLKESPQFADPELRIGYAAQPIGDMLDISGYAYIFSELDGKDFRRRVDGVWNAYFDSLQDAGSAASLLSLVTRLQDAPLSYRFPRDDMREAWRQDLERRLGDRGLLEPLFSGGYQYDEADAEKHPSKLIRELVGGSMLYYDARDVFLSEYVMKRFDAIQLNLPGKVQDFYRVMRREEAAGEDGEPQGRKTA